MTNLKKQNGDPRNEPDGNSADSQKNFFSPKTQLNFFSYFLKNYLIGRGTEREESVSHTQNEKDTEAESPSQHTQRQ